MAARWCVMIAALSTSLFAAPASLSGRWELHVDFDDRSIPGALAQCSFTQNGSSLSGRCEDATVTGTVDGTRVTWRLTLRDTRDVVNFTGMLDDEDPVILGRFSYAGKGDGSFLGIKR